MGKLLFAEPWKGGHTPEFSINAPEIHKEIIRYRQAIFLSQKDLYHIQNILFREGAIEAVSIIDAHIQMLKDPFMNAFMEKKIRQIMKNIEYVFRLVITEYETKFAGTTNGSVRQKLLDVKDLSQRVLCNLHPKKQAMAKEIPPRSIIFGQELTPSQTAETSSELVKGFVTEICGTTSHTALIMRAKGIPCVANVNVELLLEYNHTSAIVDGYSGIVIINPEANTYEKYHQKGQTTSPLLIPIDPSSVSDQTMTQDCCKVSVSANIEHLDDLDLVKLYQVDEIGLCRSEFLFLGKDLRSFSEEEQYLMYRQVITRAGGRRVIFRAFDIGGDKGNCSLSPSSESNPSLGCRAIRFLLSHQDFFVLQLRALLRITSLGPMSILLPLISDVTELIEAKTLIQSVVTDLRSQGYQIIDNIQIGAMIEVPSAVLTCDLIAKECDFFSIGTNDLIQYTLATDRVSHNTQPYYKPTHPSIIRMIDHLIRETKKHRLPVNVCGEMAADPLMIPLLLGLGVRRLSCAPRYIPKIKKMISSLSLTQTKLLIKEILYCKTAPEVEHILKDHYQDLIASLTQSCS